MKKFILVFVGMALSILPLNANAEAPSPFSVETPEALNYRKEQDAIRQCTDAYSTYSDAKKESVKEAKENKIEAEKELKELNEDLAKKTSEAQKEMADAQKDAEDAEIAYGTAKRALQDQLDEVEKNANEAGQALVKELQTLYTQLEDNLATKRDDLNTEFQNSIMQGNNACKTTAEQNFMSRVGIIRDTNQKQNSGFMFSGGASVSKPSQIKKARAEIKKAFNTCISETKRLLEAKRSSALAKFNQEEKTLKQDIQTKQQELDRITNSEYKKKLASLEADLQNEQKKLTSAQNKAKKDQDRIAQKLAKDQANLNEQIILVSARSRAGIDPKGKDAAKNRIDISESEAASEEAFGTAQSACCDLKTESLLYPRSKANTEICKKRKKPKVGKTETNE